MLGKSEYSKDCSSTFHFKVEKLEWSCRIGILRMEQYGPVDLLYIYILFERINLKLFKVSKLQISSVGSGVLNIALNLVG